MYNIEDKIKSWYKNNGKVPVVADDTATEDEKKKKQEEELIKIPGLTVLTDEELTKKAQDSLIDEYNLKMDNLNKDLDLNIEKLNAKTQEKIKDIESEKLGVNEYYDKLNKKSVDNSIKQGISRSSILDEQVSKNNFLKEKEFSDIDSKVEDAILSNQKEVDYQNKKYENQVESLDAKFAMDVKEKFNKLKAEQDKKIDEYLKENGNLNSGFNEKEYSELLDKYKNVKLDDIDLEEFDKLKEEDKTAVRQVIFDDILKYYYSMTPEEAKKSYENDERIKKILGSYKKVLERYLDSYK